MTSFVLPLMQGFIGQTPFSAPPSATATPDPEPEITEEPAITKAVDFAEEAPVVKEHIAESKELKLTLTLISRRSTYRAGLRYLRRGIDEQGHTANSVETEQLLSTPTWGHVFSYLQIRGSIPLFFSQSPYSLRPRPVLLLSDEANSAAMRTHFKALQERYGGETHVVNLVEMHGSEAVVGDKFRDGVAAMNAAATSDGTSPHVGWTWFDFHSECRGMRFENVGRLFTGLDEELSRISYTTTSATTPSTTQSGILRTNCMDCLDRTNVVQSFSARLALTSQLATLGTSIAPVSDTSFNLLWADNGDAISKQYASTAALKGDFTRTRKRNLQGALTDLGLSVSRYFTNIITDFFSQATIDFLLGSVTTQVFSDFEAEMITSDPAVSLSRARLNAIEIAAKIVVADEAEEVRGGWTFLSPVATSSKHTPLVEKVLLLTDCAAYLCTYSWTLEKVEAFERVPVENVAAITMGAYITSTLAASNTDPARNVGLVISYRSDEGRDMIRVNTRSLQTMPEKKVAGADGVGAGVKFWALKAVPGAAIAGEVGVGKQELVEGVCKELVAVCEGVQEVVSKDVVGLEEAKRGTGLVERFGYAVKRLVWA